jgi:hypothetical protein
MSECGHVLTDIELDFDRLAVEELYPSRIPDLFSSKPVVVKGRYKQGGKGTITLRGTTGEGDFERQIDVILPGDEPKNEVLAPIWARAKVEHLMHQDLAGIQRGSPNPAMKEETLGLGLRFQLLTQFTSFVAVEHLRITEGDTVRTVPVPVEMPEGVDYEGVFGRGSVSPAGLAFSANAAPRLAMRSTGRPVSAWNARRLASPKPKDARAKAEFESSRVEMLRKQLDGLEKAGKSDEMKKQVVDELLKIKLAPALQGLAKKVATEGSNGNLTIGNVKVRGGRVEVRIQLTSLSDEVLAKLKELGFKELGRAKSVKLLIGTINVQQLEALAKVGEVRRVDPSY